MLRYYYLTWFSQPVADRAIYQAIPTHTVNSIVEIGVGQGVRSKRLFEMAIKPRHAEQPLRYTGIDLFEARAKKSPGLRLKEAYRVLKTEHVKLQLVPGDVYSALARAANGLANTDLLIIGQDLGLDPQSTDDAQSLAQAWRYVPRMVNEHSLIFRELPDKKPGETKFERLTLVDIKRLANASLKASRKAA